MARRKSLALAGAIAARANGEADAAPAPRRKTYAASQEGLLGELGGQAPRTGRIRQVNPARCRMWAGHNRMYELLDQENCASLIASIKALGRQEVPAIARPIAKDEEGDPEHDYEVVCGARRHFAVSWLREREHRADLTYLIDVRDLSDEEAFRVADAENRDREDISDYERSRDYGRALAAYYDGNKKLMAERIGVDRSWLSRFVRIAELPDVIVAAYGDPRRLGIKHAAELSPLLASIGGRRLTGEARVIAGEQEARLSAGERLIEARTVLARLKRAAEGAAEATSVTRKDEEGRTLFRLEHRRRSVVVTIPKDRLADVAAVLGGLEDELSG